MLERRHSDRFEIPGARVNYRVNDGEELQMPLKNITHGGICFEIKHPLEMGELVTMDIKLPGNNKIFLKGTTEIAAAVQFLPFGTDERYNSFISYQQIKEVLTKHMKVA